jgi:hypothetical protein
MSSGPIRSRSAVIAESSQATVGHGRVKGFLQAGLMDRDPAGTQGLEPGRGRLDEVDIVAEPGEPDGRHQTDVPGTDDRQGAVRQRRHRGEGTSEPPMGAFVVRSPCRWRHGYGPSSRAV